MYEVPVIGLSDARAAIDAVLAAAGDSGGRPIAVALVDPQGDLVAYARQDGASHLSRDMAIRKAYTSARLGADTEPYGQMLAGGGLSMSEFGDPRFTRFGGGICLFHEGRVAGGIGVSGRSPDEDAALARTGAETFSFSAQARQERP